MRLAASMGIGIGRERQAAIYRDGVSGHRPSVPTAWRALEQAAEAVLPTESFAYLAGGAGLETTMDANRAAFDKHKIVPRFLRDVSTRDTSVELFGRRHSSPFLTAPIGVLELAHAEADRGIAKAAAQEDVTMIISSQASTPME